MAVWGHPRPRGTSRDGAAGGLVGRLHHRNRARQDRGVAPGGEPLTQLGERHAKKIPQLGDGGESENGDGVFVRGDDPRNHLFTMKARLLLSAGLIGGMIATSAINVPGFTQTASQIEEFHSKRFGSGGWTQEEIGELMIQNINPDAEKLCGTKKPGGEIVFPDDPSCLYKNPKLGVELAKAQMQANKEANKYDRVATKEELASAKAKGIHVWDGMRISVLQTLYKLENSRRKLASKGNPTTMHGHLSKTTESIIEMGQVTDLCGGTNGTSSQLQGDIRMRCKPAEDGSRRVRTNNSVVDIKGDGSGSIGFTRNHEHYADKFSIDTVRNEGDIYNIDNQDGGEVNVHARGSHKNLTRSGG